MKNISDIFINRPITTALLTIAIIIFGILAYFKLPIANLPDVEYPVITISASYPGANPQIMASSVAAPLERQCMRIPGLTNIISNSSDGSTQIILNFDLNKALSQVTPDVQAAIQRAKPDLPPLPQDPTFKRINPTDFPIIQYAFYSNNLNHKELYNLVNTRAIQPISIIEGVASVETEGYPFAIRIKLDPTKMTAYNVTFSDVIDAITNTNVISSGGGLNNKYSTYSINPKGQLTTVNGYNNLVVKYSMEEPVRISDIGTVYRSTSNENFHAHAYGEVVGEPKYGNYFVLNIIKQSGANTVKIANDVKELINRIKPSLPKCITSVFVYDMSQSVIASINDVKETLLFAFILVILVMFFFLGRFTDTIIPGIVLIVTVIATFLIMYLAGFSIDNLSLLALILTIGFAVDDSIVVLENTIRHIETGMSTLEASIKSVKEITSSVVSMSLSLIIVFIPIVFLEGIIGRVFKEFAFTVIIAVFCSGILSLTLTPMMNAYMLAPSSLNKTKKSIVQRFNADILARIIKKYEIALRYFLNRPYLSVVIWLLCIIGTFVSYFYVPKSFIPKGDSGLLGGAIVTPQGTSSSQIRKFQNYVYNILKNDPNVFTCSVITGGNPGVNQSTGSIGVSLKPLKKRKPIEEVLAGLQKKMAEIPFRLGTVYLGAQPVLPISAGGVTTAGGRSYSYVITGMSDKNVYNSTLELEKQMKKMPELSDVESDVKLNVPVITFEILHDKASSLGVRVKDIEDSLDAAYAKKKVTQFSEGTQQYEVYLEAQNKYRYSTENLSQIFVKSLTTGQLVPLSSVAKWKETVGPASVKHYQQLIGATISFNIRPEIPLSVVTQKINALAKQIFPVSVCGNFEGTAQQFLSVVHSMGILIFIAIFLLYILLGVLYESYIHPFTVLTTLPIATVGGLATLLLCRSELSIFAYVGIFLLMGIVVKNGIMMVDFAIQEMRDQNKTPIDAIYNACLIRFRPILMTGLTSIVGALPIVIGIGADSSLRRPLGLMIVGGLIASQIITLFVTPGIFVYMQKIQGEYLDKYQLTRSRKK